MGNLKLTDIKVVTYMVYSEIFRQAVAHPKTVSTAIYGGRITDKKRKEPPLRTCYEKEVLDDRF